ncbi:MAG TPA: ferritin-like domain-containing protein [Roseimicrobium sp.]|nr:ferritin-like domain-containing protein [Roseimicrobium sp.]
MNYTQWIRRFRHNRENRIEPDWNSPISLQSHEIKELLPSLEQFQLGDGGGPASLIAFDADRFRNSSDEQREVVDLWFTEEREHSRLLGNAVRRFGGRKIESHWSFTAFCTCRRFLGVRFELQILLLTEIVSTAYYRLLRRHVRDEPVKAMCSLILRDEAGHVSFHRDRLAAEQRNPMTLFGLFWQLQFWVCGHVAAAVLWTSHRRCLKALGGTGSEYFAEVRYEIARFIRRLERNFVPRGLFRTNPVVLPSVPMTHH